VTNPKALLIVCTVVGPQVVGTVALYGTTHSADTLRVEAETLAMF
jgi:hypothetical protein